MPCFWMSINFLNTSQLCPPGTKIHPSSVKGDFARIGSPICRHQFTTTKHCNLRLKFMFAFVKLTNKADTVAQREEQKYDTWNDKGNQLACISEATNHLQIKLIHSDFPETIQAYLLLNWSPGSSVLDIPWFLHHFQ